MEKRGRKKDSRKTIPCGLIKDSINGDYDCSYGTGITCDECICNGGKKDPRN
jgi:hypothetical protein